ncbi:MAG: hypothetical protein PHW10_01030 [Candidatus Peribacteraceae bacterium]|nr:hypothetical protein [Candidatus Peribacteraceae bacterium]
MTLHHVNTGTREHRLVFKGGETPAAATNAPKPAKENQNGTPDIKKKTDTSVNAADKNTQEQMQRATDTLKQFGRSAANGLGKVEDYFKKTAGSLHTESLSATGDAKKAKEQIRDFSGKIGTGAGALKSTIQGLVGPEMNEREGKEPDKKNSAEQPDQPKTQPETQGKPDNKKPEAGTPAPEQSKETKPKTEGERIQREMKQAMRELKEAKDGTDKFAAFLKVIALAIEYFQRIGDKSLNNKPETKEEGQEQGTTKGTDKPADGSERGQAELTTRRDVMKDVRQKQKEKPDRSEQDALTAISNEKQGKIEALNQQITEYDEGAEKGSIKGLIETNTQKTKDLADMDAQIQTLKGKKETPANVLSDLQAKRDNLKNEIDANAKQVTKMQETSAQLKAERDKTQGEKAIVDQMAKELTDTQNDGVTALKENIKGMLVEKNIASENFDIVVSLDANGKVALEFTGLTKEAEAFLKEAVPPAADGKMVLTKEACDTAVKKMETDKKPETAKPEATPATPTAKPQPAANPAPPTQAAMA